MYNELDRYSAFTRNGKKTYHNPYEYGARQNVMGPLYRAYHVDNYSRPGIPVDDKFPGNVRNVNVESTLWQPQLTHAPGQRQSQVNSIDNLLPFNPQDTSHIIWQDNMPRGGYPTRTDRLDLN